jgi:hypothetical protein
MPMPGVNFINILQAAFTCADPNSAKKIVKLSVFCALSGSVCTKAACKTLLKLTPDVINQVSKAFFAENVGKIDLNYLVNRPNFY